MKITKTENAVILTAGATALAKMEKGFLARTTLAEWLNGSLGIRSLLFATALEMAVNTGLNIVEYGDVWLTVDDVKGNGYCKTVVATAHAVDCYCELQTATVTVCYDHNDGNTTSKKVGYIPAVKTENNFRIKQIDGNPIDWAGCSIVIE